MKEFVVVEVFDDEEEFEQAMEAYFVDGWKAEQYFYVLEPHPRAEPRIHYVAYMTREEKPQQPEAAILVELIES